METSTVQSARPCGTVPAFAAITALVVDDEPHVRTYLRLVLNLLGVSTVWEAADGVQALALYQQHRPVVMMLDVNMPMMSGEDVILQLADIDSSAAVIMVSAENELETVKRFAGIGAIGYVLKFLPREKVTKTLAEIFESLLDEQTADQSA